jgi:methionine-gamma-lyase
MKKDTLAVHAGRDDFATLGVHAPPIDFSTTYPFADLDQATASYDSMVGGGAPLGSSIYARLHNPTVARFEEALAALEHTDAAVAFSSGMAAMTAVLLAMKAHGAHVVAIRPVYGGTDHLLQSGLLGGSVTFCHPHEVAASLRPDTGIVILETPANPTLGLADIADVVRQAGPVPVLVDNTFATPILQNPARLGATFVLHSGTKFLGGHGDVLAGVVATTSAWAMKLRQVRAITGAVLHPLAGYLLHRGLQTLPIRVRAQQANAQFLAERLRQHPAVLEVLYPDSPGADPRGLLGTQQLGPGSLLSFRVAGGHESARVVLHALRTITCAVSLGAVDTLIEHPAGITHRILDEHAREDTHITEDLLRLSVGLEDPADLWADLEQALGTVRRPEAQTVARSDVRMVGEPEEDLALYF